MASQRPVSAILSWTDYMSFYLILSGYSAVPLNDTVLFLVSHENKGFWRPSFVRHLKRPCFTKQLHMYRYVILCVIHHVLRDHPQFKTFSWSNLWDLSRWAPLLMGIPYQEKTSDQDWSIASHHTARHAEFHDHFSQKLHVYFHVHSTLYTSSEVQNVKWTWRWLLACIPLVSGASSLPCVYLIDVQFGLHWRHSQPCFFQPHHKSMLHCGAACHSTILNHTCQPPKIAFSCDTCNFQ